MKFRSFNFIVACTATIFFNYPAYSQDASEIIEESRDIGVRSPIGTIISSMLTPQQFRSATKDCEIDDINDPYKNCRWMPADGQLAPLNSAYDKFFRKGTDRVHVVDLRGVFIRGLNEFDPNAELPVANRQKNPDPVAEDGTPLEAGEFQPDATKKHLHTSNFRVVGGVGHSVGKINSVDTLGVNNTERTGESEYETRPRNVSVYFYVRIN